jgi:hypothetical protein
MNFMPIRNYILKSMSTLQAEKADAGFGLNSCKSPDDT